MVAKRRQHLRKARLIDGMLTHSPSDAARTRLHQALAVFPLYLLRLAHDYPTRIWLLDQGERLSSAAILGRSIGSRHRYGSRADIDKCEGLTTVVDRTVAVVSAWQSTLVLRHEFAHAVTTFLSAGARGRFVQLYERARQRGWFVEPLAAENPGEYTACALSSYFEYRRQELFAVDPPLLAVVHQLVLEAEELSLRL